MFYFDEINGKKVLKSSLIEGAQHCFTTRECNINEFENLVHPTQTHTANVEIAQIGKTDYPDTDGLILANTEQTLMRSSSSSSFIFESCSPVITSSMLFARPISFAIARAVFE